MPRTRQQPGQHTPAAPRNPSPRIAGGTLGGLMPRPGMPAVVPQGDAAYLWMLVLLEVAAIAWLRKTFKRYHGG